MVRLRLASSRELKFDLILADKCAREERGEPQTPEIGDGWRQWPQGSPGGRWLESRLGHLSICTCKWCNCQISWLYCVLSDIMMVVNGHPPNQAIQLLELFPGNILSIWCGNYIITSSGLQAEDHQGDNGDNCEKESSQLCTSYAMQRLANALKERENCEATVRAFEIVRTLSIVRQAYHALSE